VRPPKHNKALDSDDRSDEQRIRTSAVALLARREHSSLELARKLARRGFDRDASARVIADLDESGLLSDDRFVDSFVTHRSGRGQGPVRIRAELRELGIEGARVDQIFDSARVDWAELAAITRRRRFGAGPPRDFAERAKQARFLQYRGFTQEQIRAALDGADDSVDAGLSTGGRR